MDKMDNCSTYTSYTNKLGNRMGCSCNYNVRDYIEPCKDNDLECLRKNGFFSTFKNSSISFCPTPYQTNDNRFMGCDVFFPYDNNIVISDQLSKHIKFIGEKNGIWSSKEGGYIKYDIIHDNIINVSFNTRQGGDEIAKCGIMKTISMDPELSADRLSNQHISVEFVEKKIDNALHKALGNKLIKVVHGSNFNIQIDSITQSYGQLNVTDLDYSKYDYKVYGLGPVSDGSPDYSLDWLKRNNKIRCNEAFGNAQVFGIHASHWPIVYIQRFDKTTEQSSVFAIYFDHYRKLEYDFRNLETNGSFSVSSREPEFRLYVITGNTLADVKQKYMKLIGNPSVVNRKLLGLWVGGFGYQNTQQIENMINDMRLNKFPMDGFYLDLYWYGQKFPKEIQINKNSWDNNICYQDYPGSCVLGTEYDKSKNTTIVNNDVDKVGIFEWDTDNFSLKKIEELYDRYKYGVTLIYEPYYNLNALDLSTIYKNKFAATSKKSRYVTPDAVWREWLGSVIIPDFTTDNSGAYFFSSRMKSRMSKGTFLWWNDLGEPEVYNQSALYSGMGPVINDKMYHLSCYKQHPSVHNYVQFLWSKGSYESYLKYTKKRYNVLTRAGSPGITRYGVFSWTGDTTANIYDMNSHVKNMGTLILSGNDFVCSDAGGFNGDKNEQSDKIFTYWFSNCCGTEITVKPHKWFSNTQSSAPSLWGEKSINLENIKTRYKLLIYYYSIAFSISKYGYRKGKHFSLPSFMIYPEKRLYNDQFAGLNMMIGDSLLIPMYNFKDNLEVWNRNVLLPINESWFCLNTKKWYTNTYPSMTTGMTQYLVKNNSIIVMSQLPSDLVDINSENILDYPLDIHIYSQNLSDRSDRLECILYLDDGVSVVDNVVDNVGNVVITFNNNNIYVSGNDTDIKFGDVYINENKTRVNIISSKMIGIENYCCNRKDIFPILLISVLIILVIVVFLSMCK